MIPNIKNVKQGSLQIAKVLKGDKIVWENWKHGSGSLVYMKSANTPAPFSVSGGESYINFAKTWETWNLNENGGTFNYFQCPVLNTNQIVIPVKFQIKIGTNIPANATTLYLQGRTENGSWVNLGSVRTPNMFKDRKVFNGTTGLNTTNCKGYQYFKLYEANGHPFGNQQVNNFVIGITEWYVKPKK